MPHQQGIKVIATNKKAYHDYFVEERYECGIALFGTEVKSVRLGKVNLKESWAQVRKGEIWIEGMHISSDTLTNVVAKERLNQAAESVREGKGLGRSLQDTKLFTPMMLHMISSGEKSGELDNMLGRAAANQSNEFKRNVTMALSVFEPLLIISMAGIVLFIVISILQPLMQMNSMVKG